jgi:aspartyl-tRNA(Asn)/glutamyl-tRNA(Gln) amidotransferase subunit B
MDYELVIGLEVHTQMKTKTKIFCSCSTAFGRSPNENTCPVCLGLPGVLPVLNKQALEYAIRACLATHSEVQEISQFDRKNYFYPDLPKGYLHFPSAYEVASTFKSMAYKNALVSLESTWKKMPGN